MKTTTTGHWKHWTPLFINFVLATIAIALYVPFGLRADFGLFEEFTARYGYLRLSADTRLTTYWPFQAADWLAPDSYFGFNWMMVATFWLKGAVMVGIMRRLFPNQLALACLAGVTIMIFPGDAGFMSLRSVAVHTSVLYVLSAVYCWIGAWQQPHWAWWPVMMVTQMFAVAYEINYPLFMLMPLVLIWLVGGIKGADGKLNRRLVRHILAWGIMPTILGLRAASILLTGEAGYVSEMVNRGTKQEPLTLAVIRESIWRMYKWHFNGWVDGARLVADSPDLAWVLVGGVLAGVLVVWVGHFTRRPHPQPLSTLDRGLNVPTPALLSRIFGRGATPPYHLMVLFGPILMLASFGLFIATPFRFDSFRVFTMTTIGATVTMMGLLGGSGHILQKVAGRSAKQFWLGGWAVILVVCGMAYQFDQHRHFIRLSGDLQRLFGGIAAEAPTLEDDTVLVVLDRDYNYQDLWHLGGRSYIFEAGVQWIYDDYDQRAILCVLGLQVGRHGCDFGPDELVTINHWGEEERLPYERLVVLHVSYDGRIELLENLPLDYLTTGVAPGYNPLARVEVNASPPRRVHTAFPCWPLDTCLDFPAPRPVVDHVLLDMTTPPPGGGWEGAAGSVPYRWTVLPNASLHLPLVGGTDYELSFRIIYVLTPEILESLTASVNGMPIALTRTQDADGAFLYRGVIPAAAIDQNVADTTVFFRTAATVSPASLGLNADERSLGVLFDWIEIGAVE